MPVDYRFHLAVGSRFENIELVQVVLKDCLQRIGMDDDAQHWVDVAVREALANAIKHGNLQHPDKQVQVDLAVEGDDLVIRVEDEGPTAAASSTCEASWTTSPIAPAPAAAPW